MTNAHNVFPRDRFSYSSTILVDSCSNEFFECFQLDDHNIDRYMFYQPFYWPTYRYAARRALYVDPIPHSLGFEYPDYWLVFFLSTRASRYKWYTDWLNPTYWRRYRDPNYDRPLWNSWRPWQMDRSNIKRAIDMYRNGLIDFKTLDDKWITPTAYGRHGKDWSDVYLPAARYGAHRYFYAFF
ncbi:unnamed protein product [Angiostrongylus costaricensis]|uniref:Uncharacterized protein n=1 Tax=Angiostrongylus costaricensis TaxID=334426 RepID=A0A0R3PIA9_ANGCS|nr:unnamed protein product [Angiostrongylus costaricensis]